jgi:hypothetical protein
MLSRCKLSESSAELLGSIISSGKSSLENLDLSYNHFNSYALSKLIESLLSNKNSNGRLKSLNLAWNYFRRSLPLESLYKFVSSSITLLHLDLSCCFESKYQVKSLIKAVSLSRTLQVLHLDDYPKDLIQKCTNYIRRKLNIQEFQSNCKKSLKNPQALAWVEQLKTSVVKDIREE